MWGLLEFGKRLTTEEIVKIALPSVVTLSVKNASGKVFASGSGFVVSQNLIATNRHVIEDAVTVTANFQDGRSETVYGTLNGMNAGLDLCILVAKTKSARPLRLADTSNATLGSPVVAIGSPEGFSGSVSTGIISGIRLMDTIKIFQTSAPISHGSSGGPLLNYQAEVLGVTSFMDVKGQNLNFAYAAYYLRQIMKDGNTFGYSTFSGDYVSRTDLLPQIVLSRNTPNPPSSKLTVPPRIYALIQESFTYLGVPYLITGESRLGISSGAFVSKVFKTSGVILPVSPAEQSKIGRLIKWGDLSPGDRLYFDIGKKGRISHAGIYLGNGYFIHSSTLLKKVDVDPLDNPYYFKSVVCGRRSL